MASTRPRRPGKLSMFLLLELLVLSFGATRTNCATPPDNSTDVLWLQAFSQEISSDPFGWFNSWNSSSDHCLWPGVRCSRLHPGRVVALELSGLNLAGHISSSIGNLTFLRTLNLSTNSFSGQLPPLKHLQKLHVLDLRMNQLHDTIPDAIVNCSKLRTIDLAKNFLVGEIPPKIGALSNLSVLRFSWNNLTGVIPPILSNITSLRKLLLSYNSLTGSIPDELGKLTNMWFLALGGNRLSGGFPLSLFNLSNSLETLGLESNMLTKELPPNIGDGLPNLQMLFLSHNMFQGQIPASLGNASGLERLELSRNNLTGQITSSLGKLSNLNLLNLEYNNLEAMDSQSWEFFNALTNCTSLETLSLANNELQGAIPDKIGNFSSSQTEILLGGNKLSGTVPPGLGNLGSLFSLGLEYNNLTGTIEEWIGNLTNLQVLTLQGNSFTGPLPSSLGQLTQLTVLNLGNNKFEGPIPPTLGNIQPLLELNLSGNNLQGNIPIQVGSLTALVTLDLSSNKLTGEIPDTLVKCQNIYTIQMGQNFLVGTIPTFLGMLQSLSMLNLSHNYLSGAIPAALNGLQLSELDLSYNHLQGEIPENGVFENATSIYLDGNWGLCGGVADLHTPLCPAVSRRSKTEYYLVRALIPLFGFMSLVMLAYLISTGKKKSRRANLFLLSFGKKFPRVSYKDLNQATGNFSQAKLLGRGSYGSVYRGKLTQAKIQVAIKVFDLDMKFADKSFATECDVLRSIRHRNLLPLLTACSTIDNNGDAFKALIYEFMPNGNLDTWLHGKFAGGSPKCLSLAQRTSIAVGIADALVYLHHDCERQIVHCDLKPTNILLDDDMNAYLGDFGIASLVGHSSSNTSVGLKGTIGYIAPEYAQSGQASIHGDVYSFGIVLLELLIGKRPMDPMFENELNLVNFAERNYPDQTLHIIDARLLEECEGYIQATITMENVMYECLSSLMQVALSCTRLIPRERMNIREVTNKLHSISTSYIRATKREQVILD